MKLFVIILCLLSERFLMHTLSYKRFIWFDAYCKKIIQSLGQHQIQNPWYLCILFILPILVCVSIVYVLLHSIFFGLIGFILSLLIFFYCLGPQNPFYPITEDIEERQNISNYLADANGQLFAVIFWYILSGPIGLLIYRLFSLCRGVEEVSVQATQVTNVLDWVPARMTMLLYLLVGNFQKGFPIMLHSIYAKPHLNHQLLGECGVLALSTDAEELSIAGAEQLVERACLVLLVCIAVFTLIAWL